MSKKVKYVQLESAAVISDADFISMTAAQRGIYWTIILHMYCNNGKCVADEKKLKQLCNCRNFSKHWPILKKKFISRNGGLEHKRVNRELRRARKYLQVRSSVGLKGAQQRWLSHSSGNAKAIANEKRKESKEKKKKVNTNPSSSGFCSSGSGRFDSEKNNFLQELYVIIPPFGIADRITFRGIAEWIGGECETGRYDERAFRWALDCANEAIKDGARNPAALFITILKDKLGYESAKDRRKKNTTDAGQVRNR